jgi:hypothetical protein
MGSIIMTIFEMGQYIDNIAHDMSPTNEQVKAEVEKRLGIESMSKEHFLRCWREYSKRQ